MSVSGSEQADDEQYRLALGRAMDILAVREHSAWQLRRKLERKFSQAVAARVLERLEELELLDDARFAREYVRQRIARSPRSSRLLMSELISRGVERATAAGAVEFILEEKGLQDLDLAEQAAAKKLGALFESRRSRSLAEKNKEREKMFRFLAGRGFQASTARQVIDKLLGSP
ncbi:MAG: regulatory protein RecX [Gemmatimonadota bacterium]|nr:regulatory protein RecX [Gemmatimonadota bacterium]